MKRLNRFAPFPLTVLCTALFTAPWIVHGPHGDAHLN